MMASIKFRSREEAIVAMFPSADATILSEFLLAFEENLQGPEKKHYVFLGQASLNFTSSLYIRQKYKTCSSEILEKMRNLCSSQDALARCIGIKHRLDQYATPKLTMANIVECIVGITQDLWGTDAVLSIVSPVLDEFGPDLFRPLPKATRSRIGLLPTKNNNNNLQSLPSPPPVTAIKIPPPSKQSRSIANSRTAQGPSYRFAFMIKNHGGQASFDYDRKTEDPSGTVFMWGCRVIYRLCADGPWLSHLRYAQNKKRAKHVVAQDIMQYYKANPAVFEEHKQAQNYGQTPEQAQLLPIDPKDYTSDADNSNNSPESEPLTPSPNGIFHDIVHVPEKRSRSNDAMDTCDEDDREYHKRLMEVLLGDFERLSTTEQPKRCKISPPEPQPPVVQQKQQPMQSPSSANNQPDSVLKIIRSKLDITRVEKMLKDPVQRANPKSSMFSYVYNLKDLSMKSTFTQSGPAHDLIFEATTHLYCNSDKDLCLSATGRAEKKNLAESHAILNLMEMLVSE